MANTGKIILGGLLGGVKGASDYVLTESLARKREMMAAFERGHEKEMTRLNHDNRMQLEQTRFDNNQTVATMSADRADAREQNRFDNNRSIAEFNADRADTREQQRFNNDRSVASLNQDRADTRAQTDRDFRATEAEKNRQYERDKISSDRAYKKANAKAKPMTLGTAFELATKEQSNNPNMDVMARANEILTAANGRAGRQPDAPGDIPSMPRDKNQLRIGQVYRGPDGSLAMWNGTGMQKVAGAPAASGGTEPARQSPQVASVNPEANFPPDARQSGQKGFFPGLPDTSKRPSEHELEVMRWKANGGDLMATIALNQLIHKGLIKPEEGEFPKSTGLLRGRFDFERGVNSYDGYTN